MEIIAKGQSKLRYSDVPVGAIFICENETFIKARYEDSNSTCGVCVGTSPYCNKDYENLYYYDGRIINFLSDAKIDMIIKNAKIVW